MRCRHLGGLDLGGLDLGVLDLGVLDLDGLDLGGLDLDDLDLGGLDLDGLDLGGLDLSGLDTPAHTLNACSGQLTAAKTRAALCVEVRLKTAAGVLGEHQNIIIIYNIMFKTSNHC